jgi:hypothetical protein
VPTSYFLWENIQACFDGLMIAYHFHLSNIFVFRFSYVLILIYLQLMLFQADGELTYSNFTSMCTCSCGI